MNGFAITPQRDAGFVATSAGTMTADSKLTEVVA